MANINDEEFDKKINTIVSSLLDKSFKSSIKYVAHSKRCDMTTNDWIYSLKCLSILFIKSINNDEDFNINFKILTEINEEDNDKIELPHFNKKLEEQDDDKEQDEEDNSDEDNSDEEDNSDVDDEDKSIFKESLCKCQDCVKINKYNNIWEDYEPINMIQEVIKKSIDEIIYNKFLKYI